jgi:hypothetical protein
MQNKERKFFIEILKNAIVYHTVMPLSQNLIILLVEQKNFLGLLHYVPYSHTPQGMNAK